jgi:hypothetical protein
MKLTIPEKYQLNSHDNQDCGTFQPLLLGNQKAKELKFSRIIR